MSDSEKYIIGMIAGVIISSLMFAFIFLSINRHGYKTYNNTEEWEMKEMPDGTVKLIVHRRAITSE